MSPLKTKVPVRYFSVGVLKASCFPLFVSVLFVSVEFKASIYFFSYTKYIIFISSKADFLEFLYPI